MQKDNNHNEIKEMIITKFILFFIQKNNKVYFICFKYNIESMILMFDIALIFGIGTIDIVLMS